MPCNAMGLILPLWILIQKNQSLANSTREKDDGLLWKDESTYSKYFTMLKMGLADGGCLECHATRWA
ncbi:hypothetical protein ACHAW5_007623 [Stephanodiscus triporus]|uniref:Uncharacterized protein n=1 Tax=Stephanodiscus triporus TaxID=2934178 RepID=A0ABD3N6A7_9STRA